MGLVISDPFVLVALLGRQTIQPRPRRLQINTRPWQRGTANADFSGFRGYRLQTNTPGAQHGRSCLHRPARRCSRKGCAGQDKQDPKMRRFYPKPKQTASTSVRFFDVHIIHNLVHRRSGGGVRIPGKFQMCPIYGDHRPSLRFGLENKPNFPDAKGMVTQHKTKGERRTCEHPVSCSINK